MSRPVFVSPLIRLPAAFFCTLKESEDKLLAADRGRAHERSLYLVVQDFVIKKATYCC